jgi:hypothetical protein
MGALTIPVLPCISLPETLTFYRTLGFDVTHQQTKPNVYAATSRGDIHLHFVGVKGLNPAEAYSTCLVLVPEIEGLYQSFADALRPTIMTRGPHRRAIRVSARHCARRRACATSATTTLQRPRSSTWRSHRKGRPTGSSGHAPSPPASSWRSPWMTRRAPARCTQRSPLSRSAPRRARKCRSFARWSSWNGHDARANRIVNERLIRPRETPTITRGRGTTGSTWCTRTGRRCTR